jgi:hypothetical protein
MVVSDSQPLRYMSTENGERAFAYGSWIAIGEVNCDCASDGLAIENLQKVQLVEDLLHESVTDNRTIGVMASCGWAWT